MALSAEVQQRNRRLGERIAKARTVLGMSQRDLSVALSIPYYSVISQMERGSLTIPANYWVPLSAVLGMDRLDWILDCLETIEPEKYRALFGEAPRASIYLALKPLGRYYERDNPYRS